MRCGHTAVPLIVDGQGTNPECTAFWVAAREKEPRVAVLIEVLNLLARADGVRTARMRNDLLLGSIRSLVAAGVGEDRAVGVRDGEMVLISLPAQ